MRDNRAGAAGCQGESPSGCSQTSPQSLVLLKGQEGKGNPSVPVPTPGLQSHTSFFFPSWEIRVILLFLASSQPLADITERRVRKMLSPFPSCHRVLLPFPLLT